MVHTEQQKLHYLLLLSLMILYRKLIDYLYTPETKFFYIVATYSQKYHGT